MEHLYHYTTAAGLYGILSPKKPTERGYITLRLSNIAQMNDGMEYEDGMNLFQEFLDSIGDEIDNIAEMTQAFKEMHAIGLHGVSDAKDLIYTMSFSEDSDDLGQWRGYTSQRNGYCIIFNKEKLIRYLGQYTHKCCLAKCLYQKKEKLAWFEWAVKNYQKTEPNPAFYGHLDSKLTLGTKVKMFLSAMKDESFTNEHEWRLICPTVDIDHVVCHEYGGVIKSYYCLALPIDVVEGVIIGPDVKCENVMQSLRVFLRTLHLYNENFIRFSEIPFRYSI